MRPTCPTAREFRRLHDLVVEVNKFGLGRGLNAVGGQRAV